METLNGRGACYPGKKARSGRFLTDLLVWCVVDHGFFDQNSRPGPQIFREVWDADFAALECD